MTDRYKRKTLRGLNTLYIWKYVSSTTAGFVNSQPSGGVPAHQKPQPYRNFTISGKNLPVSRDGRTSRNLIRRETL